MGISGSYASTAARTFRIDSRTAAIEAHTRGEHAGRQSKVAAGRVPANHDAPGIETVLLGIIENPPQSASAIFDGAGCQRHPSHPILDVDDRETHLEIREEVENMG